MNTPDSNTPVPWYGTPREWSQILAAGGQGASNALQGAVASATNKREAKEAKRRTLANLLNQAFKRNQGLFRVGQEYANEMNDLQSQSLQNTARGFVNALSR
jgi:hypothetical protein